MKGDKAIIAQLNTVLADELVAINQYFLHARMYKNWGLSQLDSKEYKVSIRKMKNADKLTERILFLEGLPNLQHLGRLRIGENTEEMLQANMDFELEAHANMKAAIAACEQAQDFISRDLLESLQEHQEEQIDWLETQQSLIKTIGLEKYLQSQM